MTLYMIPSEEGYKLQFWQTLRGHHCYMYRLNVFDPCPSGDKRGKRITALSLHVYAHAPTREPRGSM